jgi:hypothetical protein
VRDRLSLILRSARPAGGKCLDGDRESAWCGDRGSSRSSRASFVSCREGMSMSLKIGGRKTLSSTSSEASETLASRTVGLPPDPRRNAAGRDALGRLRPGVSGNPAKRFKSGVSGNPTGKPKSFSVHQLVAEAIDAHGALDPGAGGAAQQGDRPRRRGPAAGRHDHLSHQSPTRRSEEILPGGHSCHATLLEWPSHVSMRGGQLTYLQHRPGRLVDGHVVLS